jgi:hypothetical protein
MKTNNESETRLLFNCKAKDFERYYKAYVEVFGRSATITEIFEELRKIK